MARARISIYSKGKFSYTIEEIPFNLWITGSFGFDLHGDALPNIIPKIYRCDANYVALIKGTLTEVEFDFLANPKFLKRFDFFIASIMKLDNSELGVAEIVKKLPNAIEFYFVPRISFPLNMNLSQISMNTKISLFIIEGVENDFDLQDFFMFAQKNLAHDGTLLLEYQGYNKNLTENAEKAFNEFMALNGRNKMNIKFTINSISNGFSTITCHKPIAAFLPGAEFNVKGLTRKCINSVYCVRSFGIVNGRTASFSSCVAKENEAETCGDYPNCKIVTTGFGETLNNYKICCCKTNLCNSATFEGGETLETLAQANISFAHKNESKVVTANKANFSLLSINGLFFAFILVIIIHNK